ncbi:fructose-2,6-bisphosphatase TIGAR B-like [Sinocyclocheilus grahami]|uniref:fructose-2,6-bisphosphate 2-phosphatase n=1 Tax=Sinocyclocheilus grahami TaxID=75366 RepID=A0A672RJ73_SINGR|nr:PREDICTED: fructose-2,6-bisphosphatase TIGAR B-like [Sinocyclocheilus grahami]
MLSFALTIVRHGETQYNRDKLLQGQGIDTLLSDTGHQQAAAAGQYLRDLHFTNVFVSNLQRAVQTAEIILGNNLHSSATEMISDPLLRERGFGVAEGRPKEHLKNMANAAGQACRDYTPPGGETLEQVKTRFKKFLRSLYQRMLEEHGSGDQRSASTSGPSEPEQPVIAGLANDGVQSVPVHTLIVSHGAFIRVSVRHLVEDLQCRLPAGLKMSQVFSPCPNTGISRFIITLRREESGPRASHIQCVFINRKDHLDDSFMRCI